MRYKSRYQLHDLYQPLMCSIGSGVLVSHFPSPSHASPLPLTRNSRCKRALIQLISVSNCSANNLLILSGNFQHGHYRPRPSPPSTPIHSSERCSIHNDHQRSYSCSRCDRKPCNSNAPAIQQPSALVLPRYAHSLCLLRQSSRSS